MNNNLTMIIPTHNRHNYLERILEFYKDYNIFIKIYDSSENIFESEYLTNELIEYIHCPTLTVREKFTEIVKTINTDYILYCADDDFIFPNAIDKCIEFLDKNDDYVCAQGKLFTFINYQETQIIDYHYRNFNSLIYEDYTNNDDLLIRLKNLSNPYRHTIYAVHRTKNLQEIYENINKFNIKEAYLIEFTQAILTLISGKVKELNIIYHLREFIKNSGGSTEKTLKKLFELDHEEINLMYDLIYSVLKKKISCKEKEIKYFSKEMLKNFFCFMEEWNTQSKRASLTKVSNNSKVEYDKLILQHLYESEPLIKKAELLINKFNIPSGLSFINETNYNISNTITLLQSSVSNIISKLLKEDKSIVLYGAGNITKIILALNSHKNIVKIVDKDEKLHKTNIQGVNIFPIESLNQNDYDIILITVLGREKEIEDYLKREIKISKSILSIKI